MLLVSPVVLKDVDYALLLTFVMFLYLSGNIGKIDWMSGISRKLYERLRNTNGNREFTGNQ